MQVKRTCMPFFFVLILVMSPLYVVELLPQCIYAMRLYYLFYVVLEKGGIEIQMIQGRNLVVMDLTGMYSNFIYIEN